MPRRLFPPRPHELPFQAGQSVPPGGVSLARFASAEPRSDLNLLVVSTARSAQENTGATRNYGPFAITADGVIESPKGLIHDGTVFWVTPRSASGTPLFGSCTLSFPVRYLGTAGEEERFGITLSTQDGFTYEGPWQAVGEELAPNTYRVTVYTPEPFSTFIASYTAVDGTEELPGHQEYISTRPAMEQVSDPLLLGDGQFLRRRGVLPWESVLRVKASPILDPRQPVIAHYSIVADSPSGTYAIPFQGVYVLDGTSLTDEERPFFEGGQQIVLQNAWELISSTMPPEIVSDARTVYRVISSNPLVDFRLRSDGRGPLFARVLVSTGSLPQGEYSLIKKPKSVAFSCVVQGFDQEGRIRFEQTVSGEVPSDGTWKEVRSLAGLPIPENVVRVELVLEGEPACDIAIRKADGTMPANMSGRPSVTLEGGRSGYVIVARGFGQEVTISPRYYVRAVDLGIIDLVVPVQSSDSSWRVGIQEGSFFKLGEDEEGRPYKLWYASSAKAFDRGFEPVKQAVDERAVRFGRNRIVVRHAPLIVRYTPDGELANLQVRVNKRPVSVTSFDARTGVIELAAILTDLDDIRVDYEYFQAFSWYTGYTTARGFLPLDLNPLPGHELGLTSPIGGVRRVRSASKLLDPIGIYLRPSGIVPLTGEGEVTVVLKEPGWQHVDLPYPALPRYGGDAPNLTWDYYFEDMQWRRVDLQSPPTERMHAQAAFDEERKQVVIYGGRGLNGAVFSDTITFDGSFYTVRFLSGPGQRYGHGLSYDPVRKVTVLFGGTRDGVASLDDTWLFNGGAWVKAEPTRAPEPRFLPAMASEPGEGKTVLFGGCSLYGDTAIYFSDTWVFNGLDWSKVSTEGPSPRRGACLVYDEFNNRFVLYGGYHPDHGYFTDTWTFDLETATWKKLNTATAPEPVAYPQMIYHPARRSVILFAGESVWELEESGWHFFGIEKRPEMRIGASLAFDRANELVTVAFGRKPLDEAKLDDTGTFEGTKNSKIMGRSDRTGQTFRYQIKFTYDEPQPQKIDLVLLVDGSSGFDSDRPWISQRINDLLDRFDEREIDWRVAGTWFVDEEHRKLNWTTDRTAISNFINMPGAGKYETGTRAVYETKYLSYRSDASIMILLLTDDDADDRDWKYPRKHPIMWPLGNGRPSWHDYMYGAAGAPRPNWFEEMRQKGRALSVSGVLQNWTVFNFGLFKVKLPRNQYYANYIRDTGGVNLELRDLYRGGRSRARWLADELIKRAAHGGYKKREFILPGSRPYYELSLPARDDFALLSSKTLYEHVQEAIAEGYVPADAFDSDRINHTYTVIPLNLESETLYNSTYVNPLKQADQTDSISILVPEERVGEEITFTFVAPADRERIEPGSGVLEPVYHSEVGPEGPNDLKLGDIILKPHLLPEHLSIQDQRVLGGGLKEELSRSQGQALWDEGPFDGELFQRQGSIILRVTRELLRQNGGPLSQEEIRSAAERFAPLGQVIAFDSFEDERPILPPRRLGADVVLRHDIMTRLLSPPKRLVADIIDQTQLVF